MSLKLYSLKVIIIAFRLLTFNFRLSGAPPLRGGALLLLNQNKVQTAL